jgi:hypothetical protein
MRCAAKLKDARQITSPPVKEIGRAQILIRVGYNLQAGAGGLI